MLGAFRSDEESSVIRDGRGEPADESRESGHFGPWTPWFSLCWVGALEVLSSIDKIQLRL